MAYFKDTSNHLHFLSAEDLENGGARLLPEGSVEISNEEAAAIANPPATLDELKEEKLLAMQASYVAAIQSSVSFTSSDGSTKSYQADNVGENSSQTVLLKAMQGYSLAGAVPDGFYWVADDNVKLPFTLVDLQGLYGAMLSQGWAAFQNLQNKKSAIRAASTIAAVNSINW